MEGKLNFANVYVFNRRIDGLSFLQNCLQNFSMVMQAMSEGRKLQSHEKEMGQGLNPKTQK